MAQRMAERLAHRVNRDFVGRQTELAALHPLLEAGGPRVVHVHGIAGMGKSALLDVFAAEARGEGAIVVRLDCRTVEPTVSGFLRELSDAAGMPFDGVEQATARLGELGAAVILALDSYEVFRLMDTWLRQIFVPALPDHVRLLCVGRQRPLPAWRSGPAWQQLFQSLSLGPLDNAEVVSLFRLYGFGASPALRAARLTHGHPLALQLAISAYGERPDLALEEVSLQQAVDVLTGMFLEDVKSPVTRQVLEAGSVVRRVTVSLLRAMFPGLAPRDAYERLRKLPFVDSASDGLLVHDAVREAIVRSLRASDPSRWLAYRRAAWQQLLEETKVAGRAELWRYTADMLYLIENPVVREAFFPSGTHRLAVEPAGAADGGALARIVEQHEGKEAAGHLLGWWRRMPQAFSVVRGRREEPIGFCCKLISGQVEPAWLIDDPITSAWRQHLKRVPVERGQVVLFCRRWLSATEGDSPSDAQAAVWLDLKRTYMELRPALRRVYLTLCDLAAYAPVAGRLGFEILPEHEVALDGRVYHSAVLDFGPRSVDGWLAALAAAELGIEQPLPLLDPEARELVLDGDRVALTPLEFGVMGYLDSHEGKAVSRIDLLRTVWGTSYTGGSNVVDAVVRGLRRKLGGRAGRIETVTGVGYRLRPDR